jgi:hypothetical protein
VAFGYGGAPLEPLAKVSADLLASEPSIRAVDLVPVK